MARTGTRPAGMTMPRLLATLLVAAYLLASPAGSAVTGLDDFAGHRGHSVLGFHVNPLHNMVHIGVLGVVMGTRLFTARVYGWILFGGYGALFVYGLLAVANPRINGTGNKLHAVTALLGLFIALWPTRCELRSGRPSIEEIADTRY